MIRLRFLILFGFLAAQAWAQSPHDPITILSKDEGVTLANSTRQAGVYAFNCEGTPITCTWNAATSTLTLTVSGGSGITTLNTLTADPQLFATGTTGTDFNISSATATHTFNLPTASGTNRGLLSTTDWTTFNGKQAALGFTPENSANKNAASGYAGLDAGSLLSAAQFPNPSATTLGGIKSLTCGGTDKLSAIGTDGLPVCSADETGAPGAGDISSVGDVGAGAAFDGTQGTTLTFYNVGGNATLGYDGTTFNFSKFITANVTGALTGNATTATGLQGDPTDCGVNQFATAIATSGNLTCAQPAASNLSDGTTGTGAVVLATSPTFVTSALSPIFSGTTADPADTGVLRLSNGEQICWEASPTGTDFCITGDSSSRIAATTFVGALVGNADTATTATTANAGDSATLFFSSGTIEDARLSTNVSLLGSTIGAAELASADFGDFTCNGTTCAVDSSAVDFSELAGTVGDAQIAAGAVDGGSGGEIADGTVDSNDLATANKTITKTINIFDPTTGDTNLVQIYWPAAVTLQRVACSIDTGTSVTIQFDERAEATPNTAGTNSMTSALVCDTDSQTTTSFSDAVIAADVPHNLQITGAVGTPGVVRIHVKAQVN